MVSIKLAWSMDHSYSVRILGLRLDALSSYATVLFMAEALMLRGVRCSKCHEKIPVYETHSVLMTPNTV